MRTLGFSSGVLLWGSPLMLDQMSIFSTTVFLFFCRARLGMKPSILKNDPLESDFNYQKTQQHKSNNRQEKLQDDMPSVGLVQSTTGFSSTSRTFLSSVLIILCNTCVILFCSSILFWVMILKSKKKNQIKSRKNQIQLRSLHTYIYAWEVYERKKQKKIKLKKKKILLKYKKRRKRL